jgi:hypothetical protein
MEKQAREEFFTKALLAVLPGVAQACLNEVGRNKYKFEGEESDPKKNVNGGHIALIASDIAQVATLEWERSLKEEIHEKHEPLPRPEQPTDQPARSAKEWDELPRRGR